MAERHFDYLAYLKEAQEVSGVTRGMMLAGLVTGGAGLAFERIVRRPLRGTLLDKPLAVISRGAMLIGAGLVGLGGIGEVMVWQALNEIREARSGVLGTHKECGLF